MTAEWDEWLRYYQLPPIGYVLRRRMPERWTRFYTLPEGRRLPQGAADMAEQALRHQSIATAMIGIGAEWAAYLLDFDDHEEDGMAWVPADLRGLPLDEDLTEQLEGATLHTASGRWGCDVLGSRLAKVDEGRSGPFVLLAKATGNLYCPYDGGADVIVREPSSLECLRKLFSAWTPNHPEGL